MYYKTFTQKLASYIASAVFLAILITIGAGYLLGYKAILVNGWSAEPYISYQSVIVVHRPKFEDLKVGDFITFSMSGKSYVTHQITEIDYENDVITCQGWHYNSETQQYEHQTDKQVMQYQNVVGKVIYTNYIIGKTIFIFKENKMILFGVIGIFVISLLVRKELSIDPKFK